MLATLLALSAFASVQNSQFPKPNVETPAALLNNSIFQYMTEEDRSHAWKPFAAGRDWSNLAIPTAKSDAVKVKILLAVAERDFSDPRFSTILESRDKTRLLEAAARLKSLYLVVSNGALNVEIIPRFYTDPIYDPREFKNLIDTEFNRSRFEADDSVERGPFAAIVAISSSHVESPADPGAYYTVRGFTDLRGSSQDMWLEEGLFQLAQSSVQKRLADRLNVFARSQGGVNAATGLPDTLDYLQNGGQKLYDPNFRQDAALITKYAPQGETPAAIPPAVFGQTAIQSPASVDDKENILTYTELSLLRAGGAALPFSSKLKTAKSLKFEVKTATPNPIAFKLWTSANEGEAEEVILGSRPGMISVEADNNWHTVSIDLANKNGNLTGLSIGVPKEFFGTARLRSNVCQYQFRNFELSQDAGTMVNKPGTFFALPTWETEDSLRQILTQGSRFEKRTAMRSVEKLKAYKGLVPTLLNLTGDLDSGIAHDATVAYFEVMLNAPTAEDLTTLGKFLKSPPNDAARDVALSFVGRNPSFAFPGDVAACSVRPSWRTRMFALHALGDLYRAGVKEKEFCKQLVLTSTAQDMALIRKTAIEELDAALPKDAERLIYLMVNDGQESVRLKCLQLLAKVATIPKDKILGTLADDSPTLREQIPAALGPTHPLLREALQKMVVDQDPYVRASALRGLAGQKNVQDGEIQNTFADAHPAVQIALLEGAKKGAWKIPGETLEKLKASSIKAVATLANEVK